MKKANIPPLILFNASVILAGLASPNGGSAWLLNIVKLGRLKGLISEIILDEVTRRATKVGLTEIYAKKTTLKIFKEILPPPKASSVNSISHMVIDPGDAHILASAQAARTDYLVSLDKKHILSLKSKIKAYKICSPKELIEILVKR